MKFDFRRLTPALVTSLGLLFLALLCASIGWTVFAWVVGLLGLALNVVGVAVVQIDGSAGPDVTHGSARKPARQVSTGTDSSPAGADPAPEVGSGSKGSPLTEKARSARARLRDSASRSGRDADSHDADSPAHGARSGTRPGSQTTTNSGSSTGVGAAPDAPDASASSTKRPSADSPSTSQPPVTGNVPKITKRL